MPLKGQVLKRLGSGSVCISLTEQLFYLRPCSLIAYRRPP